METLTGRLAIGVSPFSENAAGGKGRRKEAPNPRGGGGGESPVFVVVARSSLNDRLPHAGAAVVGSDAPVRPQTRRHRRRQDNHTPKSSRISTPTTIR